MDFNSAISAALGGGSATIIMGAIMLMIVNHILQKEREDRVKDKQEICSLMDEVKDYKKQEIASLDDRLSKHLEEDNPKAQKLQLDSITGLLNKLSDKFDRQCERTQESEKEQIKLIGDLKSDLMHKIGSVETSVAESKNFTQNLYNSVQKLRDGGKGNG